MTQRTISILITMFLFGCAPGDNPCRLDAGLSDADAGIEADAGSAADAGELDAGEHTAACILDRCPSPSITLLVLSTIDIDRAAIDEAVAALDCTVAPQPSCLSRLPIVRSRTVSSTIPLQAGAIQLGMTYPGLTCPESIDIYPFEGIAKDSAVILVGIGFPPATTPSCRSYQTVAEDAARCGHLLYAASGEDDFLARLPELLLSAQALNMCD